MYVANMDLPNDLLYQMGTIDSRWSTEIVDENERQIQAFKLHKLELLTRRDSRVRRCPGQWYVPHSIGQRAPKRPEDAIHSRLGRSTGQLQFHQAPHAVRIMAPGNGWGGTTAMGAEVDAWCRHTCRWQPTPQWPIRAVWFCPEFRQMAIVLKNLVEVCFGTIPRFRTSGFGGPRFTWPDGSECFIASYDRSWTHIQGIEVDLVAFDEQPPEALYREILQRRRGKRKTRVICKATQTKGWGWMGDDLYVPWLEHHKSKGLDEERAMDAQLHPEIWMWPRGSIHDNPFCDEQDDISYENRIWPTKKERKVRVYGGFENWAGDCIFDAEALDWNEARINDRLAKRPPKEGMFIIKPPATSFKPLWRDSHDVESPIVRSTPHRHRQHDGETPGRPVSCRDGLSQMATILTLPANRVAGQTFEFVERLTVPNLRVTIFDMPRPQHNYGLGFDAAYGIVGRDLDTICVYDKETVPRQQVAEAQGTLGPSKLALLVYTMACFYNQAFVVGERQVGLFALRHLYDDLHYRWLYHDRDLAKRDKRMTDALGHHRMTDDVVLHAFRVAYAKKQVELASPQLLQQMRRVLFREPGVKDSQVMEERKPDEALKIKLTGGGSPDLTMAAIYGWWACEQIGFFPKPSMKLPKGSLGQILGDDELLQPEKPAGNVLNPRHARYKQQRKR